MSRMKADAWVCLAIVVGNVRFVAESNEAGHALFTPPAGVESKGGDYSVILPQICGKTVVICEEAKSPVCCFRAESRSFRVRICPKNSWNELGQISALLMFR